jgi:hypothetical protein
VYLAYLRVAGGEHYEVDRLIHVGRVLAGLLFGPEVLRLQSATLVKPANHERCHFHCHLP